MINGLSNEDLRKIEEREKQLTFKFRVTKTIRIVSGGSMKDFDELKKATQYMFNRLKVYPYASINIKCPIIMKEEKWLPTIIG